MGEASGFFLSRRIETVGGCGEKQNSVATRAAFATKYLSYWIGDDILRVDN